MADVIISGQTVDGDLYFDTVDAAAAQTTVFPLNAVKNDTAFTIADPAATGVVGCKVYATLAPMASVRAGIVAANQWVELPSKFDITQPIVISPCPYTGLRFVAAAAKGPFAYTVRSRRTDRNF